jgi:hypothetical protein
MNLFGNKSLDGQCRFADWDVQILAAGETGWDSDDNHHQGFAPADWRFN